MKDLTHKKLITKKNSLKQKNKKNKNKNQTRGRVGWEISSSSEYSPA